MAFATHSLSSRFRFLPPPTSKLSKTLLSEFPQYSFFPSGKISYPASFISFRLSGRPSGSSMAYSSTPPTAVVKGDPGILVFGSEEELSVSLAKHTADLSEKFCRERGAFTVVISGGSLVKSLRKLVESPYVDSVNWGKWHVFWVDERVVPKDHPDSNYKSAYDGFLSKVQIPTGQVYAINDSLSAEGAAADYETCLKHLVSTGALQLSPSTGFPKFDLMLLGMGPDGHIASLFPGHPLLGENERWVTFLENSPKPPPQRTTFTFPVINSSSHISLVVTGAGKADAVHQALGYSKTSSPLLPVQMIKLEDGELTWFTDKAAVSKLQEKAGL
ncbi:hypothetical protein HPP92_025593 [Vanilla planifolia]|uniref:6-phosphogluconolactonase n=1 Tax=Vanilla planifolia TaxID=51239 RepID=A0A835PM98_VANPL|nr:hypothetical protein HPP92_025593 [Vanilla planifolia]